MLQTSGLRVVLCLICAWQASASVLERAASSTTRVKLEAAAPDDAQPLVSTHLSFSLEQDRWPDWAGINARNEFTHNALLNMQRFTGTPPKIRVGANSEDHTTWSPTVTVVEASFPPPSTITPYPEATQITVGDRYYQLSSHLPSGTHMTWGVNFRLDNATNAANMAKSIMKAFSSSEVKNANVHLDLIEIGNEADLYKGSARPSNWTAAQYTADWINIAGAVVNATGLNSGSSVSLQGASFAGQGFTPRQIFSAGILDSKPGQLITQISQHRYSGAFCSGGDFALSSFMSKTAVRSNLTVFNADIAAVQDQGLPYVLGETGSIACHGAPGVSNTAGAALWVIDYTLQAAVLGIVETYFHEGIGFKYNFIQPIALNRSVVDGSPLNPPQPALIQPSYYAAILVTRAIGTTGSAQIAEVDVDANNVSGYAIYEGGNLVRAVFVNLNAWLVSSTGTRPSVHIDLDFADGGSATVRRLVIGHADDLKGLTIGGQSYETSNALVKGTEKLETIDVGDGVDLRSTEAILISFE